MLKILLLIVSLLGATIVNASQVNLPATTYYLSSPTTNQSSAHHLVNQTDDSGVLQIRWPDFAGDGAIYKLEIALANSQYWQTVYQGANLYTQQEQALPSNSYQLRLSCTGSVKCIAGEYINLSIDIVSYQAPALTVLESNDTLQWSITAEVDHYELEQLRCDEACQISDASIWQPVNNYLASTINNYPLNELLTYHYAFRIKACSQINQCGGWSNIITYNNTKPKIITYQWRPSVVLEGQPVAFYFNAKNAVYCNVWLIEPAAAAENLNVETLGNNAHSPIRTDYLPGDYTVNGYCVDDHVNRVPDFLGVPETNGPYLRDTLTVLSEPDGIHIPKISLDANEKYVVWNNQKITDVAIYYVQYGTCGNKCNDTSSVVWNPIISAHPSRHTPELKLEWYHLNKGQHYAFRIKVCTTTDNFDNCYGWSNEVYFTIPNPIELYIDTPPPTLRWQNTSAEHHYEIAYASCLQDCSSIVNLNWQMLDSLVDKNLQTYSLVSSDLIETYYAFRIRACNKVDQCDSWSPIVYWSNFDPDNSLKLNLGQTKTINILANDLPPIHISDILSQPLYGIVRILSNGLGIEYTNTVDNCSDKAFFIDEFEYQVADNLGTQFAPKKVVVTTYCVSIKWQDETITVSQPAILNWTLHSNINCSSAELATQLTLANNSKTFHFYVPGNKRIDWACSDTNGELSFYLVTPIEILKLNAPKGVGISVLN